ncbi:MAG: Ig-like domain-containing protein [Candidatus Aenigmatarchaeota archaeon]
MRNTLIAFLLLIFSSTVNAIPTISDPKPINNTFITGGASYNFSVNVTGNISWVRINFGSEEVWPDDRVIYNMTCIDSFCSRVIEIVAAKSGTKEYFFFEANDTEGNYVSLGNITDPFIIIIDRTPPTVTPSNFENNSYISANKQISVHVEDFLSGVNESSVISLVQYTYGNETWNETWKPMIHKDGEWIADWNTSDLENNSTWMVWVNASDNVGNSNTTLLGTVIIDNELPEINITLPKPNDELVGTKLLSMSAQDIYSGISNISCRIDSLNLSLSCVGSLHNYSCNKLFDTTMLADGEYDILFIAQDNAGNIGNRSVHVNINNKIPVISLSLPGKYLRGRITINATITNPRDIINEVLLLLNGHEAKMNCSSDFSRCAYTIDTTSISDGEYTIMSKALNLFNYSVMNSKTIIIDNTPPTLAITTEYYYVKGDFLPQIILTDEFMTNESSVMLNISNYSTNMSCISTLQGRRMSCGTRFNSSLIDDGIHKVYFFGSDMAGNTVLKSMDISVDNKPPRLIFLRITPIIAENPSNFNFFAELFDDGSAVKWSRLIIRAGNKTSTLYLNSTASWSGSAFISTFGIHEVDMHMADINNNTDYISNVGYFYIGSLACGDGVCQANENYCTCSDDCEKPRCLTNETIECSSGIPICRAIGQCGDGLCSGIETCANCPEDCGQCTKTTTTIYHYTTTTTKEKPLFEEDYNILYITILIIAVITIILFGLKRKKKVEFYYK